MIRLKTHLGDGVLLTILVVCYLLGSVPWAYLVGWAVGGVDIRRVGNGNVGARNVYNTVGRRAGIGVGVLDAAKGMTAIWLARSFGLSEMAVYGAGGAAVLGHDWPVFLRFRGGQGFATTVGVLFALLPREAVLSLSLMMLVLGVTRHWALANTIGFAFFPVAAWWAGRPLLLIIYASALLLMVRIKRALNHFPRERPPLEEMAPDQPELKPPERA